MSYPRGSAHHSTKYPDSLVRELRKVYISWKAAGDRRGYKAIAEIYGLSWNTVRDWLEYRTRLDA